MNASPFDCFVVFAEMRTGSNFLETNLNALDGVQCHGEAFNPHFLGYPNNAPILGIDLATREGDPHALLAAIRQGSGGIHGFRYFHDHDPRILDAILEDRRCAKVILTRNPVESYVSWKIAQQTGQWKLTNLTARKAGQAHFDPQEFQVHLETLQGFQKTLRKRLQSTGQTAFHLAYEDLQNIDVINGLGGFLGVQDPLDRLDTTLKRQNPSALSAKVRNPEEMASALARLNPFDADWVPNTEARRGPNVPSYIVAARSSLAYLPLRGGPRREITAWLAALDGVTEDALLTKLTQKDLRRWQRQHPGHRSFTVLRHPVARAHEAFCRHILSVGPGSYLKLRQTLIRRYQLDLPPEESDQSQTLEQHRASFKQFLSFLKGNISGHTSIRVDAAWCTQTEAISGFGTFCLPDRIVREADMRHELPAWAEAMGYDTVPVPDVSTGAPFELSEVYDAEVEQLARAAYQRDYLMFGFGNWA